MRVALSLGAAAMFICIQYRVYRPIPPPGGKPPAVGYFIVLLLLLFLCTLSCCRLPIPALRPWGAPCASLASRPPVLKYVVTSFLIAYLSLCLFLSLSLSLPLSLSPSLSGPLYVSLSLSLSLWPSLLLSRARSCSRSLALMYAGDAYRLSMIVNKPLSHTLSPPPPTPPPIPSLPSSPSLPPSSSLPLSRKLWGIQGAGHQARQCLQPSRKGWRPGGRSAGEQWLNPFFFSEVSAQL